MKRFLSFLAIGVLALGLSSAAQAQTGGVQGGALLVHDAFGHTITVVPPSPASGSFTVTLPNSSGILSTGGLTNGTTGNSTLRWDEGSGTWMENLNVTSTSIGGLTAVSFSGDGSALTGLTGANVQGDISGNAGGLTGSNLSGDVTNSGNAITVNSYNGGTTFGSMAGQDAGSVAITGGTITGATIDGTAIGGTTTAAGAFTDVTADNIRLPTTSASLGVIYMGGFPWIHGYGTDNTFLGLGSGNFTLTGVQNIGIGAGSQASLSTGNENTSVGAHALQTVTSGTGNTAMGNYALEPTTGDGNTAIGNNAGLTIVAGSENTFLGDDADANAPGRTNATAIGSGAVVSADNSIQLGNGLVTAVSTSGTLFSRSLSLTDLTAPTISIPNGGTVAVTDGTNTLFSVADNGTTGIASVTGDLNIPTTTSASVGTITMNGSPWLHGYGTQNVFLGANSGNFTLTGGFNTAIGNTSLQSLTTASFNTAVGNGALQNLSNASYNTAVGDGALQNLTSNSYNTGIGEDALQNSTSPYNTAVGSNAGLAINTGLENTFLGSSADANGDYTNATAVGYDAIVTASNTVQLGSTSVTTVNTSGNIVTSGSVTVGSGQPIQTVLSASATLDFPNTPGGSNSDLTITVNGAAVGDPVFLGTPAVNATSTCYTAWVSAANTVTVRFNDYQAAGFIDPASGTFRVAVFHF